jgi:hypothetical protein
MREVGGICSVLESCMTDITGRRSSAVFFREIAATTSRRDVTYSTISKNDSLFLILQSLVVVTRLAGWNHGMRAAVAPGAVDPAMTYSIAIEGRAGVDLGNCAAMAVGRRTFRFTDPGNPAGVNRRCNHCNAAMTVDIGTVTVG